MWSLDFLPTLCQITGAKVPSDRKIDGSNFLPVLEGKKIDRKTPLFWHYYRALGEPRVAMRDGDWVILAHCAPLPQGPGASLRPGDMKAIKKAKLTTFELYNLRKDPKQTMDVAKQETQRLSVMAEQIQRLYREVIAEGPTWEVPDLPKKK